MKTLSKLVCGGLVLMASAGVQADIVHLDDVIIDGSLCTGQDCVNGEVFGFDTIRLKENNLRIKFEDTSVAAEFPARDWEIEINSSTNGGSDHFAVRDVDAVRNVFVVEGNAPVNSLYVDSGGDVGIGTSTPVVELHAVDGNTPTLRLEQNGSSGFAAQTWDVAGNEANFFVRDVTNGSTLPFRIIPGAPSSAIHVLANGNVGIGNSSPSASMHIRRTNATAKMFVEEASGTQTARTLFEIANNGNPEFRMTNSANSNSWAFSAGLRFVVKNNAGDTVSRLESNGNMEISGVLTELSDVNAKQDIKPVDGQSILKKLSNLEVSEWSYKDAPDDRHVGPMAQDFHAEFGLGHTDTGIATLDSTGIALAAIKALIEENNILKAQNLSMEQRVNDLEVQNQRIEDLVMLMVTSQAEKVAVN